MGRKLDLSGLTDNEAEHVLQVVQRDMKLRKKEEKRLSELKQELDEEGSRCLLLSRQSCFNQRCCIRCCLPFTFLFNPKRQCLDCRYNICKACRVFNKQEKAWLCSSCQKSRLLKAQSLEWYYTNVKQRFKRFGSAKVLKTLYRKHLAEHGALSDLTEGSGYEESVYNEGSICGSDSNFFRQSEEHSMAETLSVALRVAEEAIDEAISKAEFHTDSQEKQNEAHYLQEHRGELIEELAQTIVQKIIKRRKTLADRKVKNNQDWPLEQKTDPHHHHHHPAAGDQASSCLKLQSGLWRSHSAFSLLDNDSLWTFEKEGVKSTISPWKSLDTLDSTVLQSPDGNWITLQSVQLSHPSLLNKRKSLVCTALEGESGLASYGTGSDDETKHEPHSSWGAALREIHKKMTDSDLRDTRDRIQSPPTNRRGSRGDLPSDSDGQWKPHSPLHDLFKRKVPVGGRHPSASTGICITDMNFNVEAASQEEEEDKVICSRKKRKTKKEQIATFSVTDLKKNNWSQPPSEAVTPDALTCEASTPEQFDPESDLSGHGVNQMEEELVFKLQELSGQVGESTVKEETVSSEDGQREERGQGSEETDGEDDLDDQEEEDLEMDEEMESRLYKLVAQSRLCYLSSTDDELDKVNQSRGELDEDVDEEVNEQKEKKEGLASKLCQLEKEVKATQFSSTEDELDRVGVEEKTTEEQEGEGSNEELAVKVCKLANQVNATQFSSTEDELDRVGRDEETVWTLKQAAHLRDLASLDSITQFSPTEDGLDKPEDTEGESDSSCETEDVWNRAEERRESFADLDVQMFDLQDEMEEQKSENTAAKAVSENVLDNRIKTDDAHKVRTGIEDPQKRDYFEETAAMKETEEENARETQRRQELKLKSSGGKSENTEIIDLNKTRTEGHEAEAVWVDEMDKEKIKERSDDQGDWEATANSEEEDTELDRIISSMLMMTLVDIQGETFQKTAAESGRTNLELEDVDGSVTTRRGSGFKDEVIDEQSINASKETGRENRLQRHDTDVMPESAGEGKFTGEETFRKKEREELTSRSKNEQQEKEKDLGRRNVAQQVSERSEVDDENQREGSGGMETERRMKTQEAVESKEMVEKCEEMAEKHAADADERSTSSLQEGFLSPEEIQHRYSAVSLRSITTEVLKVLNATEELLQGAGGGDDSRLCAISLSPNTDVKKLDEQFCRLEENVYVAAGAVYGLEAELRDLEECARRACTSTSDMELSFLEEQVASAAARVQQSELQICDISARIGALKNAGLVVDTQSHLTKTRAAPVVPVTLESTRQLRRRLPVPPANKDKET